MAPSHVLVPLDGSPLAEAALAHALETYDCRITVLNVITPLDAGMSESGVLDAGGPRIEAAHDRADRLVERARGQAEDADRTVETVVEAGEPVAEILAIVETSDVDHVVMGGHGGDRNQLARRLLGTVATAVVSRAPVTVTVVR